MEGRGGGGREGAGARALGEASDWSQAQGGAHQRQGSSEIEISLSTWLKYFLFILDIFHLIIILNIAIIRTAFSNLRYFLIRNAINNIKQFWKIDISSSF